MMTTVPWCETGALCRSGSVGTHVVHDVLFLGERGVLLGGIRNQPLATVQGEIEHSHVYIVKAFRTERCVMGRTRRYRRYSPKSNCEAMKRASEDGTTEPTSRYARSWGSASVTCHAGAMSSGWRGTGSYRRRRWAPAPAFALSPITETGSFSRNPDLSPSSGLW
jgi:hypothetical protein